MGGRAANEEGGLMNCEEAAEFVSALCDGETIPREVAEHVGACGVCRARLNAYAAMGAELKRIASLDAVTLKTVSWEKKESIRLNWWRRRKTMTIPRFAFVSMLALVLLLSGGLVLVRARTGGAGPVLLLKFKPMPDGVPGECVLTNDKNPRTNSCNYATDARGGMLGLTFRFIGADGERAELAVKANYRSHSHIFLFNDDFKDAAEKTVWIEHGEKQQIAVPGLGEVELTVEYLDHMPTLPYQPHETLDPQRDGFRIVSPVLIRGKEVVFNLAPDSIYSDDPDATLMIYYPGEGRYILSIAPFEGAVEGSMEPGQIKFNLEGQHYLLLTAMPTTRSEHVWVSHDPRYKPSEHFQGLSDDQPMSMAGSLRKLLQPKIHVM
jgi:hypothetical protein